MRAAELRKLIGTEIEWDGRGVFGRIERGTVIDVKGRNVLLDQLGSLDWKWMPDMVNIRKSNSKP